MTLGVGLISRTFFNVPLWCGIERGMFADAGLDIGAEILDSATQVTRGLGDGTLHVAIGPPDGVLQDVAAGGSLCIIAGNTGKLCHYLIAQPRFSRIADLKGAVIGCLSPEEGTTFVFQEMAARRGLEYPGDYELRPVGGAPTRWKLLQSGEIDAGLQSIPLSYIAEDAGFSNLGAAFDDIPDYQFTTVNANRDWLRDDPDSAAAFLAALLEATRWVFANRDGAARVASREMRIGEAEAGRAWDDFTSRGILAGDLEVSRPGLAKVIEIMIGAGALPSDTDPDPSAYIEPAPLAAARAR